MSGSTNSFYEIGTRFFHRACDAEYILIQVATGCLQLIRTSNWNRWSNPFSADVLDTKYGISEATRLKRFPALELLAEPHQQKEEKSCATCRYKRKKSWEAPCDTCPPYNRHWTSQDAPCIEPPPSEHQQKKEEKNCNTCQFQYYKSDEPPCDKCAWASAWEPVEKTPIEEPPPPRACESCEFFVQNTNGYRGGACHFNPKPEPVTFECQHWCGRYKRRTTTDAN